MGAGGDFWLPINSHVHCIYTSYELLAKDVAQLQDIFWGCVAADEAHRLKNAASRASVALQSLRFDSCLLLTGTPLQNNMSELWTLMSFVDPTVFNDLDDFLEKFENMGTASQVDDLHKLLRPYLLRRVKEDVESSLPPREETIITVHMTSLQRAVYRALYDRNYKYGWLKALQLLCSHQVRLTLLAVPRVVTGIWRVETLPAARAYRRS